MFAGDDNFEVIMQPIFVPGLSLVGMLVLIVCLVITAILCWRFIGPGEGE